MIYARVSTVGQVDGGGIEIQIAACRRWCAERGRRVVGVFTDEGVSGKLELFEDRRQWFAAVDMLRRGRAAELVIYRLDRLARDLVLQEQLLLEVRKAGAALCSTSDAEQALLLDDDRDPSRAMVRQILGAVAQYEAAVIAGRMAAGRERKRAAGGYAGGRPPLGQQAVRGELVGIPEWAELIATMRRQRRAGLSFRRIADAAPRRPDGKAWQPQQVARIVARP